MKNLLPVIGLSTLFLASAANAKPTAPPQKPPEPEQQALPPGFHLGPEKITLGHGITLQLPAGDVFIEGATAKPMLAKHGNFVGDTFLGMVQPMADDQKWWASIDYTDEGYVKDDEKIDADDLLKKMKSGEDENNEDRKTKGFGPMYLDRWSELPHYDKTEHKLVWALELHVVENGKSDSSVNFETRVLGRRGYVAETLICAPEELAQYKPAIQTLLTNTSFEEGSKYSNFDSKTDKVATYGLIGLIGAGAGAVLLKGGLFAKLGIFLLKGIKILAIAVVALFAKLKNLFTGKKKEDEVSPPPAQTNSAPPPDDFK